MVAWPAGKQWLSAEWPEGIGGKYHPQGSPVSRANDRHNYTPTGHDRLCQPTVTSPGSHTWPREHLSG